MPSYDPAVVTHIVVADVKGPFKQRLGIKRYSDIPNHIPTVKWDWVLSGNKYKPIKRKKAPAEGSASAAASTSSAPGLGDEYEYEYRMDGEWEHAAFPQRIDAGKTPWGELPPKQPAPAPDVDAPRLRRRARRARRLPVPLHLPIRRLRVRRLREVLAPRRERALAGRGRGRRPRGLAHALGVARHGAGGAGGCGG